MSKKAVLGRLTTLNQAKLELTPCHDSLLRFSEAGLETLTRAINQLGAVSGNQTLHTTSYIEKQGKQSSGAVSLNEEVSFSIISMNKEGQRIQRGGDNCGACRWSIQSGGKFEDFFSKLNLSLDNLLTLL